MNRRSRALPEATVEHRRREDAAPRLRDEVAHLQSLRLSLEDVRVEGRMPAVPYVKPIVVASAPAHFDVRCTEPRCDGRHDLTQPILRALRQSLAVFNGQSACNGNVGDEACDRMLAYVGEATYRDK
jgi:hypothetical protein